MNFQLSEEHLMIQQAAKDFAETELLPGVIERDNEQRFPAEQIKKLGELGMLGMMVDPKWGGSGMDTISYVLAMEEISKIDASASVVMSVNNSLVCWGLEKHGTEEQKETYLTKLVTGEWTGTMCLTEPHCGSDLGILRTKAEPNADGSYSITGTKIFISAGDHDMVDNIVHIVLARLPGAPQGTKGISLFIVPKFLPESGDANAVSCGSLEHKMGIHGNSTCVMNFDASKGWLIGPENKGLNC